MPTISPVQIERFKREAKQLHQTLGIPHSQALDQIASRNGFVNWSLLMKHHAPGDGISVGGPPPLRFNRTAEEMRTALRLVSSPYARSASGRSEVALQRLADISEGFVSARNAVAYGIDYVQCLLTVPRFKVSSSAAVAYWEMRLWLPYHCQLLPHGARILVNRAYKPVGRADKNTHVDYSVFPRLHVHLTEDQCRQFTAPGSSHAYLYHDGNMPWYSRKDAEAYLARLERLGEALKG